jgi:hypothetical protein
MKTLRFEMFSKVNVQLSLNKIFFFHEIGGVRTCQTAPSSSLAASRCKAELWNSTKW